LKKVLFVLILLFIINCNFDYAYANDILNGITAKSAIAIEQETKQVLFEKNANIRLPMASTTKIMTAILAIENNDVNKEIVIPAEAVGVPGSSIYLEKGERLKIIELLYGLMLSSGNDAAVALAIATSGNVSSFVSLMNKKARELGMYDTIFSSPHGLEMGAHYTTAKDLAILSAYAMKNELFKKIVSTKEISIRWTTRNYNRRLVNKNKMLRNYEGADGIKTGFTKRAGRCLVTSACRDFRVICVVLNAPDMWTDTKRILDYSFNNYQKFHISAKNNPLGYVNVKSSKKDWYLFGINKDVNIILEHNQNAKIQFYFNKNFNFPIKKGHKIGKIEIINADKHFAYDLIMLEDCLKANIFEKIYKIIESIVKQKTLIVDE